MICSKSQQKVLGLGYSIIDWAPILQQAGTVGRTEDRNINKGISCWNSQSRKGHPGLRCQACEKQLSSALPVWLPSSRPALCPENVPNGPPLPAPCPLVSIWDWPLGSPSGSSAVERREKSWYVFSWYPFAWSPQLSMTLNWRPWLFSR